MRTIFFTVQLLFFSTNCLMSQTIYDEHIYGQKPPLTIPEIYEPKFSFIEKVNFETFDFSTDYNEFCYTIIDTTNKRQLIYYTKRDNGNWTKPDIAYFVPNNGSGYNPSFSPDGKYFSYSYASDLWSAVKKENKWSIAEKMPEPISTNKYECSISFAKNGSIYIAGNGRPEGKSDQCDIYCTKFMSDKLDSAKNMSNLNSTRSECSVSVSPNEEFIVFTRYFEKQGRNATDLYVSFRDKNGCWTIAQDLGPYFNSLGSNYSPKFSNDGKYFFFKQAIWNDKLKNYKITTYWVSKNYFNDLRNFVTRSNNFE